MEKKKKKAKRRKVLFDSLSKVEEREECTLWSGERGTYVFEAVKDYGQKKPLRRVYLNRKYLTGLFGTKDKTEFSGDLKQAESRVYLVFKLVNSERIEVYEKV
jgi:hypothetical protein